VAEDPLSARISRRHTFFLKRFAVAGHQHVLILRPSLLVAAINRRLSPPCDLRSLPVVSDPRAAARMMNGTPKPATPPPPPRQQQHHHPSLQYSFLTPEETASRLRTDLKSGLADHADYLQRRSIHGLNQLQDDEHEPLYIKFLNQFKESPLILLLLASAAVSVLMGNVDDAISITLVSFLGDGIDCRQF